MDGPDLRSFPRTVFSCPIELRVADKTTRLDRAVGNLSIHGLFLHAREFPVNTVLHVRIAAGHPFEADGMVRFCNRDGVGIEFAELSPAERRCLDDLIAELVPRERLSR